ncbi:MAG: peptidoglycan -binding protein [Paracoccaceae bacterium]
MAGLGRKGQSAAIWPGFLDLMTSLVMVLMFVLTVFTIVQFALRDTINNKESELADLNSQLAGLARSLGLEQQKSAGLEAEVAQLTAGLAEKGAALDAAGARISGFEAQVAGLIAEATKRSAELQATQADRDKAAADAAALTLSLEAERKKAEETLTLLAAAEAARKQLDAEKAASLSEAERQKALLATADQALSQEKSVSAEGARRLALLNEQVAALRQQLQSLQGLLDASAARDAASKVQIEALGSQLNSALAEAASEQKRRADLEEANRKRLEAEAASLKDQTTQLAKYRSEFFGRLSEVLAGRPGVRVVGDRFVFSSEVLFQPASADLAPEGKAQIAGVVATLQEVAAAIPPELPWIIRVDGHTDNVPLTPGGRYADNWELSQARALSVVRYMQDDLGFPPERLAAAGFGEYQPVAPGDTPEARAQNRRIELKLTDR